MAKEQKKKVETEEDLVLTGGYPMPEPLSYLNVKSNDRKSTEETEDD